MVETVRDYDLPGELALTEQAVADYVEWENNSNDLQVIRFFEDNEATYRAFGPYWLALARRYYNVGDYAACLRAFDAYEQLDMDIFRRDYDLAQALPLAIVAARNVQDDAQYARTAARYVQSILDNTDHDDWALRYFAAQTCVELCALTGDESHLQQAYDIALSNVNDLVTQQRAANVAYLAEVEKAEAPQGATEAQKKDVETTTECSPRSARSSCPRRTKPCCSTATCSFALADELGVSDAQRQSIDGILHEDGAPLFLVPPLDSLYWMTGEAQGSAAQSIDIGYGRSTVTVPAQYVTDEAAIAVTRDHGGWQRHLRGLDAAKGRAQGQGRPCLLRRHLYKLRRRGAWLRRRLAHPHRGHAARRERNARLHRRIRSRAHEKAARLR